MERELLESELGTLLGLDDEGMPIWLIFGAEPDEDDSSEEHEETDEEDSEDEEGDGDEDKDTKTTRKQPPSGKKLTAKKSTTYTPPSQREWERTQAALRKANETQATARKAAVEKARKEGMTEAAAEARATAIEEAEGTWKPRAINAEAKAELATMGCSNPGRLIKLIDHKAITIDGDVYLGLESQLNELKEEWPELFRTKEDEKAGKETAKKTVAPAKKVGAGAGGGKEDGGKEKPKSGASQIAARLLGAPAA